MDAETNKVLELVFQGGTALAGLILVFLAASLAAFETFAPDEKRSVRPKYRRRAYLGLAGFLTALLGAVLALVGYGCPCPALYYGSLLFLGASFVAATLAAIVAVIDIG